MNLIGNILEKILPHHNPDIAQAVESPSSRSPVAIAMQEQQQIDVVDVMTKMAEKNPENLNWRTSIVDLMKLVGLDSSLSARKELARELDFNGDTSDTASMNIWLHKQVMTKISENGGKVPQDLTH
jgi:hypothetical protein